MHYAEHSKYGFKVLNHGRYEVTIIIIYHQRCANLFVNSQEKLLKCQKSEKVTTQPMYYTHLVAEIETIGWERYCRDASHRIAGFMTLI